MTALNWRHHRIGPLRPCIYCQRGAYCRDEQDRPCHKVCAETEAHYHATSTGSDLAGLEVWAA